MIIKLLYLAHIKKTTTWNVLMFVIYIYIYIYISLFIPVVITWYFRTKKKLRLRGFQNRMLGKTFGPKRRMEKTAH
jgi:hypothetical protein